MKAAWIKFDFIFLWVDYIFHHLSCSIILKVLAVLGTNGILYFVHAHECRLLAAIGGGVGECDPLVDAFVICPNGKFMATLLADGTVALHNLKPILQQRNFIAAGDYYR